MENIIKLKSIEEAEDGDEPDIINLMVEFMYFLDYTVRLPPEHVVLRLLTTICRSLHKRAKRAKGSRATIGDETQSP